MRATSNTSYVLSAAAGALALGLTLMFPATGAQAAQASGSGLTPTVNEQAPVEMQRRGFRSGGRVSGFRGGRGGRGIGPAGVIGLGAAALIVGGAAAAAASGPRDCWIERRWVDGPYGPERRRVRVCD